MTPQQENARLRECLRRVANWLQNLPADSQEIVDQSALYLNDITRTLETDDQNNRPLDSLLGLTDSDER